MNVSASVNVSGSAGFVDPLGEIRAEIADEYGQPHSYPWIVGFSGGKDSTLVAHLVFEHLLSLPKSDRKRPVHVVANDTMVESPLVMAHITVAFNTQAKAGPTKAIFGAGANIGDLGVGEALCKVRVTPKTRRVLAWRS